MNYNPLSHTQIFKSFISSLLEKERAIARNEGYKEAVQEDLDGVNTLEKLLQKEREKAYEEGYRERGLNQRETIKSARAVERSRLKEKVMGCLDEVGKLKGKNIEERLYAEGFNSCLSQVREHLLAVFEKL